MRALMLLALLAAPAAAVTRDEVGLWSKIEARERDYESLSRRYAAALAEMNALRGEFPGSPDQAGVAARWKAAAESCAAMAQEENTLRKEHRDALKLLQLGAFARHMPGHKKHTDVDPSTVRAVAYEGRASEMKSLGERLNQKFQDETSAFEAVRARSKRPRRWPPFAAAGALLALTAYLLVRYWPDDGPVGAQFAALPAPPQEDLLLAGNIRVGERIGAGGMGEVFEGHDLTLARRVALKRLKPEIVSSPAELVRIRDEARTLAALRHPAIAALHSVETWGPDVYLVLEFAEGTPLDKLLARRGRLPWREALAAAAPVAAALDYAHAQGVVHKDLKPSNIVVGPDGKAKVTDFGLSHTAKATLARATRATGFGAPAYMSPEAELGAQDAAADVFALAVVLYESACGELPFSGPDFLTQKRERVFRPASAHGPGLPPGADALFARAFDPDPAARFMTAGGLLKAAGSA